MRAVLREGLTRGPASTRSNSRTDGDLFEAVLRFADLRKQRSRLANGTGQRMPTHLSASRPAAGRSA